MWVIYAKGTVCRSATRRLTFLYPAYGWCVMLVFIIGKWEQYNIFRETPIDSLHFSVIFVLTVYTRHVWWAKTVDATWKVMCGTTDGLIDAITLICHCLERDLETLAVAAPGMSHASHTLFMLRAITFLCRLLWKYPTLVCILEIGASWTVALNMFWKFYLFSQISNLTEVLSDVDVASGMVASLN